MTLPAPSVPELFSACNQLFGANVEVSVDFLKYLEPSGVKAAYRERVFETHPDRARLLGLNERDLAENFKKINSAYEILSFAIQDKNRHILFNGGTNQPFRAPPQKAQPRKRDFQDRRHSGAIPQRPLLIGQFLFYSGIISWRTLIDSIVWQRRNRPLIGRIARSWNLLTEDEIIYILRNKAAREKFGDYALKEGFLTKGNLLALLGKQKILAKPLVEYFIEQSILTPSEVKRLVKNQQRHNSSFNFRRFTTF